jgi:hypothetical protein
MIDRLRNAQVDAEFGHAACSCGAERAGPAAR